MAVRSWVGGGGRGGSFGARGAHRRAAGVAAVARHVGGQRWAARSSSRGGGGSGLGDAGRGSGAGGGWVWWRMGRTEEGLS